jgi:hypothetical protein
VAQHHDLKLPLTTTAGEHAHQAAPEPVQHTHPHDAQSQPVRPRSPTRPPPAGIEFLYPTRKNHAPTISYIARKTSEGKSVREAIRCLKRYLARHFFRVLEAGPMAA